jgi:hypothetical protein
VALAPKATWSPKYRTRPDSSSSSSGTRTARRSSHRPVQLVERDGEGPSTVMIPLLARGLRFVSESGLSRNEAG